MISKSPYLQYSLDLLYAMNASVTSIYHQLNLFISKKPLQAIWERIIFSINAACKLFIFTLLTPILGANIITAYLMDYLIPPTTDLTPRINSLVSGLNTLVNFALLTANLWGYIGYALPFVAQSISPYLGIAGTGGSYFIYGWGLLVLAIAYSSEVENTSPVHFQENINLFKQQSERVFQFLMRSPLFRFIGSLLIVPFTILLGLTLLGRIGYVAAEKIGLISYTLNKALALKQTTPTLLKINKYNPNRVAIQNTTTEYFDTTHTFKNSILITPENNYFSLVKKIGSGAFGLVKIALNLHTNLKSAVKIQLIESDSHLKNSFSLLAQSAPIQLDNEENLTKALGRFHGSLYRTNSKGIKKKYLFMDYFKANNLHERVKENYSLKEIITLSIGIIEELNKIHALDYLHLDLSLYNILYDDKGCIRIIDFGMSGYLDNHKNTVGELRGTHIPPEMFQQHENQQKCTLSVATDIFALGMILYELFSSNHFDAYQYEIYEDYKNAYQKFYDTALKEVAETEKSALWHPLARAMISDNPANRIDLNQALTELKALLNQPPLHLKTSGFSKTLG